MSISVGTRVGPYRIEAPIGSGGFSTVYRARDDRLDTSVAIKVLAENHAMDAGARGRFVDEARMIRKVGSDHLVALHDVGETDTGQPFLVLQLADRGDLHRRLTERMPNGARLQQTLPVIAALADALGDLHSAGLVHRDVKPHNLLIASRLRSVDSRTPLLEDDERLLLADLGFAKDLELASGYTSGGGTRWFQAPEQLPALVRLDHRADVYASTAVVAWLLAGRVPTKAAGSWQRHLDDRLPDLEAEVRTALERGLAEDPDDRPDSMHEWRQLFEGSTVTTVADQTTVVRPKPGKLRWMVGAAAIAIFAGGVGYGVSALMDDRPDPVVVQTLGEGMAVSQLETDAGLVSLTGPNTLQAGVPGLFTAEGPPEVDLFWLTNDGERLDGTMALQVSPSTPGLAYANLIAIVNGQPVTVSHAIDVQPAPLN